MTHMLKLSLMCATNDGGFLQLMSHGKNHSSRLRCKSSNSKTSSPMPSCNWMEAPFVCMTLKKIAFKVDNSEKWRIVSSKAMELH